MQIGYAAGVAADLSISKRTNVRHLSIDLLQDELLKDKQVITYFKDVEPGTVVSDAVQYFGAKGFLTDYEAKPGEPVTLEVASKWILCSRALPGGIKLPVLPASDRIMPSGVDMGPRSPKEEPAPRDYWKEHPFLTAPMAVRWANVASRALQVQVDLPFREQADGTVTRGQFLSCLYLLLKAARTPAPARTEAEPAQTSGIRS